MKIRYLTIFGIKKHLVEIRPAHEQGTDTDQYTLCGIPVSQIAQVFSITTQECPVCLDRAKHTHTSSSG